MKTTHRSMRATRGLGAWAAAVLAALLAVLMLGSAPAAAQDADGPTAEFCEAWADYQDAQDGAELNTALGAMQDALTADAPAEVAEALVTLGQGDLDPAEVQAASDVVAAWADEACAETTTTTAESTTTTAESTTTTAASTTSTDSDTGSTPSGGVDTGAGGTATEGNQIGIGLVAAVALLAAGVGVVGVAGRRRLAHRR